MWYLWAALSKRKGPPAGARGPTAQPRPVPRSASRRKRERRREEAIRSLSHPRGGSRRRWIFNGAIGAVIVGAIVVVVLLARGPGTGPTPTLPPTPSPTLNPAALAAAGNPSGSPIDGIECQAMEQLAYHIHAHLAVYVNGTSRVVPEGIGVTPPRHEVLTDAGWFVESGKCFYWLHTHTADGILHVESPSQSVYTLGQFFDIWGQPLTSTQVGPSAGTVIAYVNGVKFAGDPRTITVNKYDVIQLDVGTDFAPQTFQFPPGY
jgi:hypothetical protein